MNGKGITNVTEVLDAARRALEIDANSSPCVTGDAFHAFFNECSEMVGPDAWLPFDDLRMRPMCFVDIVQRFARDLLAKAGEPVADSADPKACAPFPVAGSPNPTPLPTLAEENAAGDGYGQAPDSIRIGRPIEVTFDRGDGMVFQAILVVRWDVSRNGVAPLLAAMFPEAKITAIRALDVDAYCPV